jgi:hypothetical protein
MKDLSAYIDHAVYGNSIRSLARSDGVHPSTILRRVRKLEHRRDDPLIDAAIDRLAGLTTTTFTSTKGSQMHTNLESAPSSTVAKNQTVIRHLERLDEKGAFLALASDMENAVIMRTLDDGEIVQTLIISQSEAQVLALNDWVEILKKGRVSRYEITHAGRMALKRLVAAQIHPVGCAEAPSIFTEQHIEWGVRVVAGDDSDEPQAIKVNVADSPVTLLSRRKGKDGKAFLNPALVTAGERLREDFELSQMGPSITQNWDGFLTGSSKSFGSDSGIGSGAATALRRFRAAMAVLGPGLSDIALYCCCAQQGLEIAEKRLGWSARSGKVVLRIALQRLQQHYQELHGNHGPMIG